MLDISAADPMPAAHEQRSATKPSTSRLKAFLREPLVHFLALGAALFLAWPLLSDRVAPPPNRIVITAGQMQRALDIFIKTNQRPPAPAELNNLAEQEVQTEVEYREGLALGLDRDDEIIRRRIAQKLRFMVQDIVDQASPSDAELQRFLDAHANDFGAEPQFAFSQIYLNPDRHGASLQQDAAKLLARLNTGDGRLNYGVDSDVLPVPNDFEATPLHNIAGMFGDAFAQALAGQKPGSWVGPFPSGYGMHLVLVRQIIPASPPKLQDVRAAVLREWSSAKRVEANAAAYAHMRAKYDIRLELPATSAGQATP